jgi:hypothetical protein
MLEKPSFLQGSFPFSGSGLDSPKPLHSTLVYTVPFDKRAQLVYFRAGNSSEELIYAVIAAGGVPKRYFPIGAKSAVHIPLAVVEDLEPETKIEILFAAPSGVSGVCVIDVGLMEF